MSDIFSLLTLSFWLARCDDNSGEGRNASARLQYWCSEKVWVMKIENIENRLVDEQKQKFVGIIKINHLSTMFSIIKGGIWLLFTGEEYSVPGDKVEIVLLD